MTAFDYLVMADAPSPCPQARIRTRPRLYAASARLAVVSRPPFGTPQRPSRWLESRRFALELGCAMASDAWLLRQPTTACQSLTCSHGVGTTTARHLMKTEARTEGRVPPPLPPQLARSRRRLLPALYPRVALRRLRVPSRPISTRVLLLPSGLRRLLQSPPLRTVAMHGLCQAAVVLHPLRVPRLSVGR